MADFAYGYIAGWARKGETPHYGIINPLLSVAMAELDAVQADERGEIFAWIVWLVEVEGIGVLMPVKMFKFRNGVRTELFNWQEWSDADPND